LPNIVVIEGTEEDLTDLHPHFIHPPALRTNHAVRAAGPRQAGAASMADERHQQAVKEPPTGIVQEYPQSAHLKLTCFD
jgi:hypothetical protein